MALRLGPAHRRIRKLAPASCTLTPLLTRSHGHGYDNPGYFDQRETLFHDEGRDWSERAFTVGIGGPVGSGKTALVRQLCLAMREEVREGVETSRLTIVTR